MVLENISAGARRPAARGATSRGDFRWKPVLRRSWGHGCRRIDQLRAGNNVACRLHSLVGYFVGVLVATASICSAVAAEPAFPVEIRVDVAATQEKLLPIWSYFGGDEINYATMRDGGRLLTALGKLKPGSVYFRAHNLLNTGDGTPSLKWGSSNVYREDNRGRPVYDWAIVDRIFDSYRAAGVRPLVELAFMPEALTSAPANVPYRTDWRAGFSGDRSGGWAYPPKDYGRWSELVYRLVRHWVERYGKAEVEHWLFETWNEPNLDSWKGTAQEFYKLHDYTVAGIHRALPGVRVGGPTTAGINGGDRFMQDFLTHVSTEVNYATGKVGTPTDFIAFHAKGLPSFVDGHVRMGISNQLKMVDTGFGIVAAMPALKNVPIIIDESDPDACAACRDARTGYRNGTMSSSYTASSIARMYELAARRGVNLEAALTWSFEFEDQDYFAGFRVLSSNGLDLPVMNVFRMFSLMPDQRLQTSSSSQATLDQIMADGVRGRPDVGVLASHSDDRIAVLIWHYHDDDVAGPDAAIDLNLTHIPAAFQNAGIRHYRIDGQHSNSYEAWRRLGSPPAPNRAQYSSLQAAGALSEMAPPSVIGTKAGSMELQFSLPRQGVSLLVFDRK